MVYPKQSTGPAVSWYSRRVHGRLNEREGALVIYEAPQIEDYGNFRELTASNVFRTLPDAEAPGEHGNVDDNSGPCNPDYAEYCSD